MKRMREFSFANLAFAALLNPKEAVFIVSAAVMSTVFAGTDAPARWRLLMNDRYFWAPLDGPGA